MEVATEDVQVATEDVQIAMEDVQVTLEGAEVASSPVPVAKKMRRLRKVKETEIEVNEEPVGELVADKLISALDVGRESAEEILKRFAKGLEEGKKRKAVQRTIFTAVVDMSKQSTEGVGVDGKSAVVDIVDAVEDDGLELPSHGGEELGVEDGGLGLRSHGEELGVGSEEFAPLCKKKRSNTVKRSSAHATGMTFESEGCAPDGVENDSGIEEIAEGSESDIGDEDVEYRGVPTDFEKDNDDAGAGGLNAGWSDGLAEEEMPLESILEKARQMVAEMSKPGAASSTRPSTETKQTSEVVVADIHGQNGKKKKSKKEGERIKREEMYAESQRLLRESKGVAFVAPAPVMKPVSSVLEKIRQRRLQLGCSGSGIGLSQESETKSVTQRGRKESRNTHEDLTVDGATEVDIEVFRSTVMNIEEVKTEETAFDVENMEGVGIVEARGLAHDASACDKNIPEGSNGALRDDLVSSRSDEEDVWLKPSPVIMDTQDLLCESQFSTANEEILPFESVGTTASDVMGLDTNEDLMTSAIPDNNHQENKVTDVRPSGQSEVYTTATHVRGLIDDEAEDEDEDILAENAEEEEVLEGDEDDLQDLIATNEKEKAGDKARRDYLHRKWLDRQDTEQTEDILERLRTGRSSRWKGRDRIVSCLDEDDDLRNYRDYESLDKNSSQAGAGEPAAEDDFVEDPKISLRQRSRSQELEMDCLLDEYEDVEDIAREEPVCEEDEIVEDEEEREQSIIRQRMLEESEEQLVFLSPADDESSREVFSLITKVNVGTLKIKSTTGPSEIRAATSAPLLSRQSFLGRSSSSSSLPPPAQRHVGSAGSSRSFVFSRDDSNSDHGFPSSQSQEQKKPGISRSVSDKGVRPTSATGPMKQRVAQPPSGPSLFEMLKKQSEELEQDLKKNTTSANTKKWASNTEAFSMFATKKYVIPSRRKL